MGIEENKALTLRFLEEGINQASMAAFDELVAEDVADHYAPPGFPPGREGWKQNRLAFKAAFPDGRWELADVVAEGDLVVVRVPFSGTHLGTFFGVHVRMYWAAAIIMPLVFWRYVGASTAGEGLLLTAICYFGLFAIVWSHEMGHIACGWRFRIRTDVITLSPLGGVAHMNAPASTIAM